MEPGPFTRLKQLFRRIMGLPRNDSREDPYAGVRVPKPRRPGGNRSAIALVEPGDVARTSAFGRALRERYRSTRAR